MGERARRLKARCHPDRRCVYAAGIWSESHAPYPGRSVSLPRRLASPRGGVMGCQKSAEAIVVPCKGRRAEHAE